MIIISHFLGDRLMLDGWSLSRTLAFQTRTAGAVEEFLRGNLHRD